MPDHDVRLRPTVVVSGSISSLAVVRSLGARGVPVVFAGHEPDFVNASKYVRHSERLPDPSRDEPAFVEALLSLAERWPGALLVPGSDATLVAIARHKSRLEEAYVVGCPGWDVVKRVIEKRFTYEIAKSAGVPIPLTVSAPSLDDVEQFAAEVDYPCLVKPSQSHLFYERFRTKMFVAADARQLVRMYEQATEAGLEVLLQEFVPGDERDGANYNSYRWEGQVLADFTAMKIRNAPARYGSPRVVVSRHIPGLATPARRLLDALDLDGFSCAEFKRDTRDGTYKLMEVNARHNLSAWLAVRCGIDFPWLEYRHRVYGEERAPGEYATDVYWIDILRDLLHSAHEMRQGQLSLGDLVRPYRRRHVFAVSSARDPRPTLERLASIPAVALTRLRSRAPR